MSNAASHPQGLAYRADIDGLRAIAVLAVIGYHAFPGLVPGGFVGVDVFFVISGYLITSLLRDELASRQRIRLGAFYVRRIRRLFPALGLVLAACLVAGWWLLVPSDYASLGRHAAASAGFIANLVFWFDADYFSPAADTLPLLHLWSLGVEEQFYLAWPLLLVLAARMGVGLRGLAVLAGVLSLAACLMLTPKDPSAAFFLPLTRFWELLAGAWLALRSPVGTAAAPPRRRALAEMAAVVGLAMVLAACFILDDQAAFPGWRALLPVIGCVLMLTATPAARWMRWLLSRPALVWIGLVSYPLYLWHWPLLSFARIHAAGEVAPLLRLALVALAFAFAGLTWWLVERPLRRRMRARAALLVLLPTMSVVLLASLAVWGLRGIESRAGEPVRAYANYGYDWREPSREGRCSLTGASGEPAMFLPECVDPPGPAARPLVAIWGDSHAALLYPGLREAAGDRLRLAQFTRSGCRPYLSSTKPFCRESNAWVIARIAELQPEYAVLFSYWTANDYVDPAQVLRNLDETIVAMQDAGVRQVVVVGPAPRWREWLPKLLVRRYDAAPFLRVPQRLRGETLPEPGVLDRALATALAGRTGVTHVSALDRLCDLRGCLVYVDDPGELTTWDYGHLGPRASRRVADGVLDALD
ncbi:acyltransferase family protein [Luteimonas sp. MJ204]|uniref:acyltransferase family protein n=1 Tax=Luteimonas sp. MJ145 TaxID=3129234 RepID=UPI0031BB9E20